MISPINNEQYEEGDIPDDDYLSIGNTTLGLELSGSGMNKQLDAKIQMMV